MNRWRPGRSGADPVAEGSVALAKGERLLTAVRAEDGSWVAGTDRALHFDDGVTLGWHEVDQARWIEDDSALEVVTLPDSSGRPQTYRIAIPEPGSLPQLVRERVTSNIVVSERVVLPGPIGARIVARRMPGNEPIRWSVIYDDAAAEGDPRLEAASAAAVARLQMRLGA